LIPNLDRIKIEKAHIAKEQKLRQLEQPELNEDSQSISFENDAGDIGELESYPLTNKYFESVFCLTDLYLYRGVCLFYLQRYADAIKDFEFTCRKVGKSVFEQTQMSNTFKSAISDKTDLSEIGLTSINDYESTYNILICHLMMNKQEECLKSLAQLLKQLPAKY